MIVIHTVVTSIVGVTLPGITQTFYTEFTRSELTPFIWLAALFVIEYLNRLGYQIASYKYIQVVLGETRTKTYGLWMRAPLKLKRAKAEDDFPLGEVLARVMSDTEAVKELITSGAIGIVIDVVFILSALIGFLRLDPQVGLSLFGLEVIACVLLIWGSRKMTEVFASVRTVTGLVSRVVADVTNGLRELSFTPHARYASKRGDRVFDDFLNKQLKANVWDAGYYSAAESLYPILLACVLIFFPTGDIGRIAILAVLIDLIQKSITPIKEIAGKISSVQRARTGLERIQEFHDYFAGTTSPEESRIEPLKQFSVRLQHYSYPEREGAAGFSLKNVTLSGVPGELVGIVGQSGCGKSTFLRLLSGQHGTFEGELKINELVLNGENAKDLHTLCQHVSLVSQDSHVFTAGLEFNVALEEGHADFSPFWEQAKRALPYLERWGVTPKTSINPKELSLGQKQLLSGLRACFLRKPIVLFDEVSSGLDPDLEKALRDLVLFVQRHSLTLIVTHRLETILSAQRLVVMKEGEVVETGTPAELKANSSLFNQFLSHLE